MLLLVNGILIGPYFSYDYPAYLEVEIEKNYGVSTEKYGFLYSMYSLPNLVLPLFSGMLFDRLGTRPVMLACFSLIMLGQFTMMMGGFLMNFKLLLLGRFMLGVGYEN